MVAIIDYGVGNLFSLQCSLEKIGAEVIVTDNIDVLQNADHLILPGVGAFGDAAAKLRENALDQVVIQLVKSGKPLLGICLGMQMLFERSYEYGVYEGLGLLEGSVVSMENRLPESLQIPHIGWNRLHLRQKTCPLFKYMKENDCVYFVHSYFAENCSSSLAATTDYGIEMTAAVAKDNLFGCQFHPEKSGDVGLNILRAFLEV